MWLSGSFFSRGLFTFASALPSLVVAQGLRQFKKTLRPSSQAVKPASRTGSKSPSNYTIFAAPLFVGIFGPACQAFVSLRIQRRHEPSSLIRKEQTLRLEVKAQRLFLPLARSQL
jgi:hypothetical protein